VFFLIYNAYINIIIVVVDLQHVVVVLRCSINITTTYTTRILVITTLIDSKEKDKNQILKYFCNEQL